MADLHDDGVMTAFLLGTLPEPGRSEVDRRLTDDEDYFEAMAALEDELIPVSYTHLTLPTIYSV